MFLVLIGWLYVALLMAVAEAMHPQGTLLGAFFTLLLYGIGPVAIVTYLLGTPLRLRARRRTEAEVVSVAPDPDAGGHAAAGAVLPGVASKREEP